MAPRGKRGSGTEGAVRDHPYFVSLVMGPTLRGVWGRCGEVGKGRVGEGGGSNGPEGREVTVVLSVL